MGTLVLNNIRSNLDAGQEESDVTSKLEALVIMNSDTAPLVAPSARTQPQVTPPLSFQNLRTLSMDCSSLGIKLLLKSQFPAVTTFELIPDQEHHLHHTFRELTLLVLDRIPTLKVIILPHDFFYVADKVLGCKAEGIQIVLATPNKWNWLKSTGQIIALQPASEI